MLSSSTKKTDSPVRDRSKEPSRTGEKTGPSPRERCFLWLEVAAFAAYILGGIGTLVGAGFLLFADRQDLGFWGQGRSVGFLLICVGLCLSVAGVLLVRYFRNRQWT